jgi:hypothetical protein
MPLPVDPGEHVVALEMAGHKPVEQRLTLELGQKQVLDLAPLLASVTQDNAPAPAPVPAPAADASPRAAEAGSEGSTRPQRMAAYVVGGVGAASFVVGVVAGGVALSQKGVVNSQCQKQTCSPTGMQAVSDGKAWSTVSTVGIAVGAGALAGGAVLYLMSNAAPASQKKDAAAAQSAIGFGASSDGLSITFKGVF